MERNSEVEDFLEHFGVKGMQWGVKNDRGGASKSTDRAAKKDATEMARAKMFYGVGAGTRRKLIKAQVESKSKHDPTYGKAFERHMSTQDLGAHAQKATGERKRTDRKEKTKQRAGYVARRLTGEMGTQAAFTAAAVGGAVYLRSPSGRRMMDKAASVVKSQANEYNRKKAANYMADYFKMK